MSGPECALGHSIARYRKTYTDTNRRHSDVDEVDIGTFAHHGSETGRTSPDSDINPHNRVDGQAEMVDKNVSGRDVQRG